MTEDVIHIKLEKDEANQAKRDILESEKNLLRLQKTLNNYHSLRKEELAQKEKILKRLKEVKRIFGKLQRTLPKFQVPEMLQEDEAPIEEKIQQAKESKYDDDLEAQLQEIQDRLNSLQ